MTHFEVFIYRDERGNPCNDSNLIIYITPSFAYKIVYFFSFKYAVLFRHGNVPLIKITNIKYKQNEKCLLHS